MGAAIEARWQMPCDGGGGSKDTTGPRGRPEGQLAGVSRNSNDNENNDSHEPSTRWSSRGKARGGQSKRPVEIPRSEYSVYRGVPSPECRCGAARPTTNRGYAESWGASSARTQVWAAIPCVHVSPIASAPAQVCIQQSPPSVCSCDSVTYPPCQAVDLGVDGVQSRPGRGAARQNHEELKQTTSKGRQLRSAPTKSLPWPGWSSIHACGGQSFAAVSREDRVGAGGSPLRRA